MSAIIKSDAETGHGRVRALGKPRIFDIEQPAAPEVPSDRELLERAIAALETKLGDRDQEIERLRAAVTQAYADGEAAGFALGEAEAELASQRAIELLSDGVGQALGQFKAEVSSLERLAPLLAEQALEKIFGSTHRYAELIKDMLRHQLSSIETGAILRVEVSASDFAEADLGGLRSDLGDETVKVVAAPHRAAGSCSVKLRLGAVDVGVDQQWAALTAILKAAAEPEAKG